MSSIIKVGYYSGIVCKALATDRFTIKDESKKEEEIKQAIEANENLKKSIPDALKASVIKLVAAEYGTKGAESMAVDLDNAAQWLTEILKKLKESDTKIDGTLEFAKMLQDGLVHLPVPVAELESGWGKFKTEDAVNLMAGALEIPKEVLEGQQHLVKIFTTVKDLSESERKSFIEKLKKLCDKTKKIESNSDAEKYISEYRNLACSVSKKLSSELGALVMEELGSVLQLVVDKLDPKDFPTSLP